MLDTEYELQAFQSYLIERKKVSPNTLLSYLRDVRQFGDWLLRMRSCWLREAEEEDVRSYLQFIREEGRAPSTQNRCAASLKCLYRFLAESGSIADNPAVHLNVDKQERKLPQILTSREVEQFLEQPDLQDPKGIRDKAMLEMLYATGIRVSELIQLDLSDVNTTLGFLRCRSGGRERVIPMYRVAVKAVLEYLIHVRPLLVEDADEAALFVNIHGGRMSRQGFWKIIKQYQKTAGIDKDITPHTLRHSFAAHLLENGADIRDIQEMLGHADVSSTQVYVKLVKNHLTDAYRKAHPRA